MTEENNKEDNIPNNGRMEFSPDDHDTKTDPSSEVTESQNSQGSSKSAPHNQSNRNKSNRNNRFKRNDRNPNQRNKKKTIRKQIKRNNDNDEYSLINFDSIMEFDDFKNLETLNEYKKSIKYSKKEHNYDEIYSMGLNELKDYTEKKSIEVEGLSDRYSLINAILNSAMSSNDIVISTGVLDIVEKGKGGVLVYQKDDYCIKKISFYVPQVFIDSYALKRGHIIKIQLHEKIELSNCFFAVDVLSVMDGKPNEISSLVPFKERIPYYPLDRIILESDIVPDNENLPMRVVDCLTPIGFGQRGLIVAPPRTGKTVILQGIANSIQINYPDAHLIVLLIDERPEEVTDFKRKVKGEVISSTFDESAESHVHAAEIVIEKSRCMVESGKDVIILLDSITRLARAYNTTMPSSGKILSGGVEANALQLPKRFFGSARNIEDGGSLTILATALVETGSKMDEVIFEEFKGTGNMELHLDRALSDKRIFPAISMDKSGTRKEELLYHPDEIQKIYALRRAMKGIPTEDAMEMLIQRIKKTKTNVEFLMSVAR